MACIPWSNWLTKKCLPSYGAPSTTKSEVKTGPLPVEAFCITPLTGSTYLKSSVSLNDPVADVPWIPERYNVSRPLFSTTVNRAPAPTSPATSAVTIPTTSPTL